MQYWNKSRRVVLPFGHGSTCFFTLLKKNPASQAVEFCGFIQNGFTTTPRCGLRGGTLADALHGLVIPGQQEGRYCVGQQDDKGLLKTSAKQSDG